MQNKANLLDAQMNVTSIHTVVYENKWQRRVRKNKPNSNPIKPNLRKAQMNVNLYVTKDYERNDIFAVPENKANSNPIPQRDTRYAIRNTRYKPNSNPNKPNPPARYAIRNTQYAIRDTNPIKPCPERSRMGQSRNNSRGLLRALIFGIIRFPAKARKG